MVAALTALAVGVPVIRDTLPASTATTDPAGLREQIMRSANVPHQGYVESSGRLSVPELPKLANVTSLLTGTTRIRTWYAAPDRERFDVVTTTSETDVYRVPGGEYTYDSGNNTITEVMGETFLRLPRAGDLLPPELARRILSAAPGDALTGVPARRVAGVSAVGLRIQPTDPDTTVGHVDIWADPGSGLPLRVEVTAKDTAEPMLITKFLEYTLTPPAEDVLRINPAPGVGVAGFAASDIEAALGSFGLVQPPARLAGRELRIEDLAGIAGVYGVGLSSFVVVQLPRDVANSAFDTAKKAGAREIGTSVHLQIPPLSLAVVRSVNTRRAFLLAGFVAPKVLEQAAGELAAPRRSPR